MSRQLSLLILAIFMQACTSFPFKAEKRFPTESKIPVAQIEPAVTPKPALVPVVKSVENDDSVMKYSEFNNMAPPSDRNYKRMTREKMEQESELNSSAGSLWKMDGQTSYLFAENKHRREGDPTTIKMEGPALKLIENKVAVVQDLLKQLDEQRQKAEEDAKKAEQEKIRLAQLEEEKKLHDEMVAKGEIVEDPFVGQYAPEPERKPAAAAPVVATAAPVAKEEKIDLKEVQMIPSKIVEKVSDGMYRIRGQQFLTIKKKPYKVIATALIRAEDFDDAGISSSKLLDAQYDVIHVKRTVE